MIFILCLLLREKLYLIFPLPRNIDFSYCHFLSLSWCSVHTNKELADEFKKDSVHQGSSKSIMQAKRLWSSVKALRM